MKRFLVGMMLLVACGEGSDGQPGPTMLETEGWRDVGGLVSILEFQLDDGTRCVAAYGGGIDCDWGER